MTQVVLTRHGEARAGWADDPDPGLSELGRAQAQAMAAKLCEAAEGAQHILVSPLRRSRETAAPLEARWGPATVEPAVGEIPAPVSDLADRGSWLLNLFGARWDSLDDWLREWRASVLSRLLAIERDTVVITHYVAINIAVGEATGDLRFHCFSPGYCSRTVLETDGVGLRVVTLGHEATTVVR